MWNRISRRLGAVAAAIALIASGCAHHPGNTDVWAGLTRESIQLDQKLLVVKGSRGIVACPYLNMEAFEALGEAAAIVSAPDFDDIPSAKVLAVSSEGAKIGLRAGMSGREALDIIR